MLATNTKQAGGMASGQLGDAHTCWAGDGAALPSGQALNPHRPPLNISLNLDRKIPIKLLQIIFKNR